MTGTDPELERWMADWKGAGTPADPTLPAVDVPATLRRRVRRRSLGLALLTAGELAFTATAIVVLWRVAQVLGTPFDLFTLITLAVLAGLALVFSLWNRWGIWRPSLESTAAYLDLSIARCARHRRGLTAGWWLLAAEVALYVPWIWHRLYADPGDPPRALDFLAAYGFLAAVGGLIALVLWLLSRRTRRETQALEELRISLTDGG
jgi:hypothetical protein